MLLLLLLVSAFANASAYCGPGFVQGLQTNDCFKFVWTADHWYAAEWHCQNLGGHLASVSNMVDKNFLASEVPSWCSEQYWLGGSNDNDNENREWKWSDQTPFNYTNWKKDECIQLSLEP